MTWLLEHLDFCIYMAFLLIVAVILSDKTNERN